MHPADQKPIEILNTLIGINNNRIECYHFISDKTDISVLKVLFSRLTETSLHCREELYREIYKLGGVPLRGTIVTSEFFKAWLEVHAALNSNDHKAILDSCYYEEGVVIRTYEEAMQDGESITAFQHQLLNKQYDFLKADCEKVRNLREVLVKE